MARSIEYGVFNDEGLIDSGFYSKLEAQVVADGYIAEGDRHVAVHPVCEYHNEQSADYCEECNSEED